MLMSVSKKAEEVFGVIVRDYLGDVKAAVSIPLFSMINFELGDPLAVIHGFRLTHKIYLHNFLLESAFLSVIRAIEVDSEDFSSLRYFVSLVLYEMELSGCLKVSYVRRDFNIPTNM